MKRVFLCQHAQAFDKETNPDRPLTIDGEKDITRVANFLKDKGITFSNIYHSGKTRARQTAGIIADNMGGDITIAEKSGLKPLDDVSIIADEINTTADTNVYVGHLPHMEKLAAYLLTGDIDNRVVNFNNGGIVCLQYEDKWTVEWIITPEIVSQKFAADTTMYT